MNLHVVDGVTCRRIPGYPGYAATDDQQILTEKQRGRWGKTNGFFRPLARVFNKRTGRWQVSVTPEGGSKPLKRNIHVLVCLAFHGPRIGRLNACHKNGDRLDDRPGNLYWGTYEQNMADAMRHGTFVTGDRHKNAKIKDADLPEIFRLRATGMTQRKIADKFGLSQSHIKDILLGRRRKHANLGA